MMEKQDGIWLNKYISESGFCSRREADKYIEKGLVYINKSKAQKGAQVFVGDIVRVNGLELEPRQKDEIIFIAFNKPVGIVSTTEKNVKDNIIDYINYGIRIFPIGRLDKDSQGLIFLTNNGDLVNRILRAGNKHEKEYIVTVNKPLTEAVLKGMADGVPMLGVTTKKCKIIQESPKVFRITLVQGLNRQIRRMCEHYHYDVVKLERTRIMHISLKGIPLGEWRELSEIEMNEIYRLTKDSSSEVIKKKKSDVPISTTEAKPKQRTSNKSIDSKKTFANKVSQNKLEDGTKKNNKLSSQTKQSKSSNFKSYRKKGSR